MKTETRSKWEGTSGLLGSFPEGEMIARDGKTIVEDANEFGMEWQVLPSEGMLFHTVGSVPASEKCAMPVKSQKRRLGESHISNEEAAAACADVDADDFEACMFDVLATNDKTLAGAY